MRLDIYALAVLATITPALAQAPPEVPPCVAACTKDNPIKTACNGGEQGPKLADCTCKSIKETKFLGCVQKCPQDQKSQYLSGFGQGTCMNELFPGVTKKPAKPNPAPKDMKTKTDAAAGKTQLAAAKMETKTKAVKTKTKSKKSKATSMATATDSTETGTETGTATETGSSTATTDGASQPTDGSGDDDAAIAHSASMALAAAGLVAAFFM